MTFISKKYLLIQRQERNRKIRRMTKQQHAQLDAIRLAWHYAWHNADEAKQGQFSRLYYNFIDNCK